MAIAPDIFGRIPLHFGGAFAADAAVATFGGLPGGGIGLLTQTLNFTYQQQITRLFEVGTTAVYYVAGRSQGQGTIAQVLGPTPVFLAFYATYGNVCNAATNTLFFQIGIGCNLPGDTGVGMRLTLNGVVLTSISLAVQAQDMVFNQNLAFMFITLLAS
jgi:hypothetical protein